MGVRELWTEVRRRARTNPLAGGLGRRLLVWFLLLSLIPLFASNTIGYLRSEGIIESLVQRYLDGLADVQATHVQDQVDRHLLNLEAVAAGNEFLISATLRARGVESGVMGEVADRTRAHAHLRRKLEELEAFEGLYVLDPGGELLFWTGPGTASVGTPAAVPPTETGRSVARVEGPDGEPRFHLLAPLESEDGAEVGFLGGTIHIAESRQFLRIPEHVAGSIESFIVDERGRPLFVSHPHGHVHYDERLATPLLELDPGSSARYRDRQGVEVIGTSATVPGYPWLFITEIPVADALGELRSLRALSIGIEILFALLVAGAAWIVAGGIVEPVRRLVAATRKVGSGDLDTRVEIRERDEIGELGSAFNEMTGELSRTSAKVEELHRREMERAGRLATVGELASGVAHEIKNPVVGISNGLDLVIRRVGDDEDLAPIVREMKRQLTRIEDAVRDLLAFARPATPTLERIDGNEVVERAVRLVHPAAEKAGVRVDVESDPGLPDLVADEELLRQALVNLIMNAVQASSEDGRVRVATSTRDEEVRIRVEDEGSGIPDDELEQIFKPFFTTKHHGTGLGLSITREIVERHDGELGVESRVGGGTTFTMSIPVRPDGASAEAEEDG